MRGYFLTNMYLSPIQCGIQAAHCMHDMFVTYNRNQNMGYSFATELLWTWAKDHKTMIVLNGGTSDDLREVFDFMMKNEDIHQDYPFEQFREPGIDGGLTCVGVVLNQRMIEGMKHVRENPPSEQCFVYRSADVPTDEISTLWVNPEFDSSGDSLLPDDLEPAYTPGEWELCRMLAHKSLA